jgi:hypothetical protein
VSISAPASGTAVSGTVVVSASASDNVGVAGVQFKLDGANLGAEVTAPPFSVTWSSTGAANGTHTLTAVARDAAGNTASSPGVLVTVANVAKQDITWINLVNAAVTGTTLRKTAGCNGCADSGAASQETIRGNGTLKVTASETMSVRYVGLGTGTVGQRTSDIKFAFAFRLGGIVEIREHATYRAYTRFVTGDVLRISVANGVVTYTKNGALIHTSKLAVPAELRGLASLQTTAATVTKAMIVSGN